MESTKLFPLFSIVPRRQWYFEMTLFLQLSCQRQNWFGTPTFLGSLPGIMISVEEQSTRQSTPTMLLNLNTASWVTEAWKSSWRKVRSSKHHDDPGHQFGFPIFRDASGRNRNLILFQSLSVNQLHIESYSRLPVSWTVSDTFLCEDPSRTFYSLNYLISLK